MKSNRLGIALCVSFFALLVTYWTKENFKVYRLKAL